MKQSSEFGGDYSASYDALYAEKDYAAECDLLEEVWRRFAREEVKTLLDIGCGTGNHALPLARRGYSVAGVDRSPAMLAQARAKAGDNCDFFEGDARDFELDAQFDAAIMMFAVLGYQLENDDVMLALKNARRHVKTGGIFCADFWHGPAVLNIGTSERMREIPTANGTTLRFSSGDLRPEKHAVDVHFRLWELQNQRLTKQTNETHRVRFFFPLEIELYAHLCGWKLVNLSAFGDLDETPSMQSWNVLAVWEAVT